MGTWVRSVQANLSFTSGNALIANIPRGSTLVRVHFGWGFYGTTHATANPVHTANNLQVMGVCTTVGDGTEAVPNVRTQSADQSPPSGRWLWWEARAPVISSYDSGAELISWRDSGAQTPVDAKGMVSAKAIPAGDTLNLRASWAAAFAWEANESNNLWFWASILYQ